MLRSSRRLTADGARMTWSQTLWRTHSVQCKPIVGTHNPLFLPVVLKCGLCPPSIDRPRVGGLRVVRSTGYRVVHVHHFAWGTGVTTVGSRAPDRVGAA